MLQLLLSPFLLFATSTWSTDCPLKKSSKQLTHSRSWKNKIWKIFYFHGILIFNLDSVKVPSLRLLSTAKSSFKQFSTKQLLRSNSFRALLLDVYVLPKISYLFEFSSFPSGCLMLTPSFHGKLWFSLNFIPNALGQTFYQVRSLQHHTIWQMRGSKI